MSIQAVLLPLFVLVALTLVLMFWMAHLRVSSVRRGEVTIRDPLRQPDWNERTLQIGNAFHNQLELPFLYYVLVALALFTRKADLLFVLLSWVFVLSRLVHAWIFVAANEVPRRFYAYAVGAIVLTVMWLIFAVRILLGLG